MSNNLPNAELLGRYLDDVAGDDLASLQEQLVTCPDAVDALVELARFELLIRAQLCDADHHRELKDMLTGLPFKEELVDDQSVIAIKDEPVLAGADLPRRPDVPDLLSPLGNIPRPPFILPAPSSSTPVGFLGSAWHGTVGFFSQELPLSLLIATVVMGTAMLGAWAYKTSHHQPQVVKAPSQSVPSDIRPEMVFVGRITGMVDCKWSDPSTEPFSGAYVPLGRKYALASGLMQITYDSGAKVILEGPCTYEVDSSAGGYLSLGKLTARITKEGETGRQGDKEIRSQTVQQHLPLSSSPPLLFFVRTPTAIVTDLGTEFGVEVNSGGSMEVHVFDGTVEVQCGQGRQANTRRLTAGQAVRIPSDDPTASMVAITSDRQAFPTAPRVASNPQKLPPLPVTRGLALWLAADVGVVRDSKGRVQIWRDLPTGENRTLTHARQLDSQRRPLWIPDAIAGKPAVRFDGTSSYLRTNTFETTADQTLLVVFAPHEQQKAEYQTHHLFSSGGRHRMMLKISRHGELVGRCYPRNQQASQVVSHPLPIRQAAVGTYRYSLRERRAELRLDGRSVSTTPVEGPAGSRSQKWIGSHPRGICFFAGDIAELLIYNADLSADEIARVEAYLGAKYGISTIPFFEEGLS